MNVISLSLFVTLVIGQKPPLGYPLPPIAGDPIITLSPGPPPTINRLNGVNMPSIPTTSPPTSVTSVSTAGSLTPAPSTSAPITAASNTPAQNTPGPITPAQITPAPNTPVPTTPAPSTAAPITTASITPAPITSAPITSAPITSAPITSAPITSAPTTPAPTTPAPITPAPITPAPTTAAPNTLAPSAPTPAPSPHPIRLWFTIATAYPTTTAQIRPNPSTPSPKPLPPPPTAYINPYCPINTVQTMLGTSLQTSGSTNYGSTRQCYSSENIATDYMGELQCTEWSCCLCKSIQCGFDGYPCNWVKFADYAAIGVHHMYIDGAPSNSIVNAVSSGAHISCTGVESCKSTNIIAKYANSVKCEGAESCAHTNIMLLNPSRFATIQCDAGLSCLNANFEIVIGESGVQNCNLQRSSKVIELGAIQFNGEESGKGATIAILNGGCDRVVISSVVCLNPTSCLGTTFLFTGQIDILECQTSGSSFLPQGLEQCEEGMNRLICMHPMECGNLVRSITNPGNGFEMECSLTGSCDRLDLTLNYRNDIVDAGGFVESVSEFRFMSANAAHGAIIKIENNQNGGMLRVDKIVCEVIGACNGLTIIGGEKVDLLSAEIECIVPGACQGCVIKSGRTGGVEYPCDYRERQSNQGSPVGGQGQQNYNYPYNYNQNPGQNYNYNYGYNYPYNYGYNYNYNQNPQFTPMYIPYPRAPGQI